jgi:uncharacterized cupredoxin-like copper-binding protein
MNRSRISFVAGFALSLSLIGCSSSTAVPTWTLSPGLGSGSTAAAATSSATQGPTAAPSLAPAPTLGFNPGTASNPRVVQLTANDLLNFTPGAVQVAKGETVEFQIHNLGKAVHEFMVGALSDAFADKEGTPEVADIAPDETKSITTTFDGDGPYAFACHAPGHFEHGMLGYIQLVGPGAPTVGTKDNPRVIWLNMDDTLKFMPDSLDVANGESIRFVLTNSGTVVHEFQVGPADMVASDTVDGVLNVEKDELDEGSTHAVDYTFDASGPYAFACHEPGHYEAGMKGVIVLR